MTGTSEHGTGWSDLDAARLLLEKLGVRPPTCWQPRPGPSSR